MQWFWEEGKRGGRTWRWSDMLVPDSMATDPLGASESSRKGRSPFRGV